jgi:hypothetical protein
VRVDDPLVYAGRPGPGTWTSFVRHLATHSQAVHGSGSTSGRGATTRVRRSTPQPREARGRLRYQ